MTARLGRQAALGAGGNSEVAQRIMFDISLFGKIFNISLFDYEEVTHPPSP